MANKKNIVALKVFSPATLQALKDKRPVNKFGTEMSEENKAILEKYQSEEMKAKDSYFFVKVPDGYKSTVNESPADAYKGSIMAMLMRQGETDRYVFVHPEDDSFIVVQRDVVRTRTKKK